MISFAMLSVVALVAYFVWLLYRYEKLPKLEAVEMVVLAVLIVLALVANGWLIDKESLRQLLDDDDDAATVSLRLEQPNEGRTSTDDGQWTPSGFRSALLQFADDDDDDNGDDNGDEITWRLPYIASADGVHWLCTDGVYRKPRTLSNEGMQ